MTTTATPARSPIRVLPPLVAGQIAAGEVVERPASVLKELVENALDAGASRVRVEIEDGGVELVRVSDDGGGIPAGELVLALTPHATSKVSSAEDLDRVATLGFRGEALASIASVARVSIRSRPRDSEAAAESTAEGDEIAPPRPASGPPGTVVTVRTLFFNTPARRKFLRTAATEQQRCVEAFESIAMARPAVGFELVADDRTLVDLPADQAPRDRALAILGAELAGQFLPVAADEFDDSRGVAIWGLAGLPAVARATARSQYLYVNGRAVRDRTIQHALREAYRGLIEPTRHPSAVLMVEVDPRAVDVNVHPAKAEVRFRDSSAVHSAVLRAVRDALRAADLTPAIGQPAWKRPGDDRAVLPEPAPPGSSAGLSAGPSAARDFADFFRRIDRAQSAGRLNYQAVREALDAEYASIEVKAQGTGPGGAPSNPGPATLDTGELVRPPTPAPRVLQVHHSYLVTQDEQGLLIVDQHALHERVMFEVLLSRLAAGPLESQRLLAPAVVAAGPGKQVKLPDLAGLFDRLGIDASPIGPAEVGVHAFPTFLFDKGVDPSEMVGEILDRAEAGAIPADAEDALRDVLDMMACKAAVRAGDRLSDDELSALVELRDSVERSSNCPHGRPTSVRLTIRELDRLFHRA